jgi:hypothetical protein
VTRRALNSCIPQDRSLVAAPLGFDNPLIKRIEVMTKKMKLLDETVLKNSVRMRFADHTDQAKASEWIEFLVPLASGDQHQSLAEAHLAALRYARTVIGDEIHLRTHPEGRNS